MIATAIGNPMANAPPIAKVNAESRFTSGRRLSSDMLLTPPIGKSKAVAGTKQSRLSGSRTVFPRSPGQGVPEHG